MTLLDPRDRDFIPTVGMMVCDCRYKHLRVIAVDEDGDTVTLEDGAMCSWFACCDPIPHPWLEHENETLP